MGLAGILHILRRSIRERSGVSGQMAGDGKLRSDVRAGLQVEIVRKQDQQTGALTRGIVKDILTNSPTHPHGIKVRLEDGQVGRVQRIVENGASGS